MNIPVEQSQERLPITISGTTYKYQDFLIRLSHQKPDYWVFFDLKESIGKTIEIGIPKKINGLDNIFFSDKIHNSENLYNEKLRPKVHFTTRRGWINDPNGLVYYDGEYHLFYQHNPYEVEWQNVNLHWGHAVSKDLVHWEELPIALYPDELGAMFSGSAVVDSSNTSGFAKDNKIPLVAIYTTDHRPMESRQFQTLAYSLDKGRSFEKFSKNPILDTKDIWNNWNTRDPKVFWHEDSEKWIMLLFEADGHSIYNSDNLIDWTFQSHIKGFWECPELFELQIEGTNEKKWVIYGASGTYMIGNFDGKSFTPESGKLKYMDGKMYASQTFNNIPDSDGRRIQIGWCNIAFPDMPFRGMMSFPTELSLRNTIDGIKLYSNPVKEINTLYLDSQNWTNLSLEEANKKLLNFKNKPLHLKFEVELDGIGFKLLNGINRIAEYDFNWNRLNGSSYGGDNIENMRIKMEIILDTNTYEIFADDGKFSIIGNYSSTDDDVLNFVTTRSNIKILNLEINTLKTIWP